MAKKTYIVDGMHCPACETNIERTVKKIKGIKSAKATLRDSKLTITADSAKGLPSVHHINSYIKKYGYEILPKGAKDTPSQLNFREYLLVGVGIIVFIGVFLLVGGSEFISGIYVNPESNAASFFGFGLAAGMSSCAALVGGMILTVQNTWLNNSGREEGNKYIPFFLFNWSRIVTFAIMGGVLGLLGSAVKISIIGSAVLTILISVFMILVGMQMTGVKQLKGLTFSPFGKLFNKGLDRSNAGSYLYPILMGALTFFVPCGFTILAQTQAIGTGSFRFGFASLGAFALGTLPVLALISFSSIKLHSNPRFSKAFQLFAGLLVVFFALFTINGQMGILGLPQISDIFSSDLTAQADAPTAPLEIPDEQQTSNPAQASQVMLMEVRGFEYFPKVINIRANTPTRFEITDNGSIGCARAVYPRGLYDQIINLEPGLNSVEFISPGPGTYQISCSMWMVEPITVIVE